MGDPAARRRCRSHRTRFPCSPEAPRANELVVLWFRWCRTRRKKATGFSRCRARTNRCSWLTFRLRMGEGANQQISADLTDMLKSILKTVAASNCWILVRGIETQQNAPKLLSPPDLLWCFLDLFSSAWLATGGLLIPSHGWFRSDCHVDVSS